MRKRHDVLPDGNKPVGGKWNFDARKRGNFGRKGPGMAPQPPRFQADDLTRRVMQDVEALFPDNPGKLDDFAWPVTRELAVQMLDDFIEHRLAAFGPFQDAMSIS